MSKKNYRKPDSKPSPEKKETVIAKKEEIGSAGKSYWDKKYEKEKPELLFGKSQFIIIAAGLVLLILGFFLMSGGAMSDESKWDSGVIYSFTRITLAPFLVLLGLGAVGYAIFYNGKSEKEIEINLDKES
jgi:hypothetical protein